MLVAVLQATGMQLERSVKARRARTAQRHEGRAPFQSEI